MRIKRLPIVEWEIDLYSPNHYGYGDVDVFVDDENSLGERTHCIFRKKDLDKYDDDKCFDRTVAIICNDCGVDSEIDFLIGLNAGQIVPVQFNGSDNPSIPIEWIQSQFWLTEEEDDFDEEEELDEF